MEEYFVSKAGGEPEGPLPESEVRRRLTVGELAGADLVSQPGWAQWEKAMNIFPPPAAAGDGGSRKKAAAAPARGKAPRGLMVCLQCGTPGYAATETKGSFVVEVALWCLFCAPGLIYSLWRVTNRTKVCPVCRSPEIVPAGSPQGRELLGRQGYDEL